MSHVLQNGQANTLQRVSVISVGSYIYSASVDKKPFNTQSSKSWESKNRKHKKVNAQNNILFRFGNSFSPFFGGGGYFFPVILSSLTLSLLNALIILSISLVKVCFPDSTAIKYKRGFRMHLRDIKYALLTFYWGLLL